MLWQIQIVKLGGPRLIQEARSVYLLGTAHAEYAKHLKLFGEMCVVADTDNIVGRQIQIIKLGGPRLIPQARSVYLLGTAPNMQEMSTGS